MTTAEKIALAETIEKIEKLIPDGYWYQVYANKINGVARHVIDIGVIQERKISKPTHCAPADSTIEAYNQILHYFQLKDEAMNDAITNYDKLHKR